MSSSIYDGERRETLREKEEGSAGEKRHRVGC